MRAIYGKPDNPDSAYILVLRGIDDESLEYLQSHSEKYSSWGCILFPERNQPISTDYYEAGRLYPIWHRFYEAKGIHSIQNWGLNEKDETLIESVTRTYPPYNEDGDSETSSMDKTDRCKRIADIINDSELFKELKEFKKDESDIKTSFYPRLLGVPTSSSFIKIPRSELINVQHKKGKFYEEMLSSLRGMKIDMLKPLIDNDSLWDVDISTDASNPYDVSVNIELSFKGRVM